MASKFLNKASVIKAANFIILRKVIDKMDIDSEIFYKELGVKSDVVKRIVSGDFRAGLKWNSQAAADKMKMSNDVFSGKHLLLIQGESIKEIQQNFDKYVNDDKIATKIQKSMLLKRKNEYITEYALWKAILEHGKYQATDLFQRSKVLLLSEVGKQVEEEDFQDLQLFKFWNYWRKKLLEIRNGSKIIIKTL